jgi:hypothetical protein
MVRVLTWEYERGVAWPAPFREGGIGAMPDFTPPVWKPAGVADGWSEDEAAS